jgi:hypothetical protein
MGLLRVTARLPIGSAVAAGGDAREQQRMTRADCTQ